LNGREIDSVHLSEPDDAANPMIHRRSLLSSSATFLLRWS
jgi:hypothetical protein